MHFADMRLGGPIRPSKQALFPHRPGPHPSKSSPPSPAQPAAGPRCARHLTLRIDATSRARDNVEGKRNEERERQHKGPHCRREPRGASLVAPPRRHSLLVLLAAFPPLFLIRWQRLWRGVAWPGARGPAIRDSIGCWRSNALGPRQAVSQRVIEAGSGSSGSSQTTRQSTSESAGLQAESDAPLTRLVGLLGSAWRSPRPSPRRSPSLDQSAQSVCLQHDDRVSVDTVLSGLFLSADQPGKQKAKPKIWPCTQN